jgi:hypothetical protein
MKINKVLKGLIPQAEKGAESPNKDVEAPMSKRIKIEDEKELKLITLEVDVLPRVRPYPKNQMTSACLSPRLGLTSSSLLGDHALGTCDCTLLPKRERVVTLGASLMLLSMCSSCWTVSQRAPVRGDCVFKQDAALCYDRACLFDVISFVCFL